MNPIRSGVIVGGNIPPTTVSAALSSGSNGVLAGVAPLQPRVARPSGWVVGSPWIGEWLVDVTSSLLLLAATFSGASVNRSGGGLSTMTAMWRARRAELQHIVGRRAEVVRVSIVGIRVQRPKSSANPPTVYATMATRSGYCDRVASLGPSRSTARSWARTTPAT